MFSCPNTGIFQFVDILDDIDSGVMFFGDFAEHVSLFNLVALPFNQVIGVKLHQLLQKTHFIVYWNHQMRFFARFSRPAIVGRVQLIEFLDSQAGHIGGLGQVNLVIDADLCQLWLVGDRAQCQANFVSFSKNLADGEQARHIGHGFFGQLEGPVISRKLFLFVLTNSSAHIASTGIVGGQRQVPVAIKLLGQ